MFAESTNYLFILFFIGGAGLIETKRPLEVTDGSEACSHGTGSVEYEDYNPFAFDGAELHLNEKALPFHRCHPDEFRCKSSQRCIPRLWIRDGCNDCITHSYNDTSDEDQPLTSCDVTTEFRCNDHSQRCIPRQLVANGVRDCHGNGDEMTTLVCDNQTEFRCHESGRCVPRSLVNDGFHDCRDGSDEDQKIVCLVGSEFDCGDGNCIQRSHVGDGVEDCSSGKDEEKIFWPFCNKPDEFRCFNGERCIPDSYRCDGYQHCADGSDEIESCQSPLLFRCLVDGQKDLIGWRSTLDSIPDCDDGSDGQTHRLLGFKCVIGDASENVPLTRHLLPQYVVEQNMSLCADHTDACFDSNGKFVCEHCLDGKTMISKFQICDGIVDCPDLSDECSCQSTGAEELCEVFLKSKFDMKTLCNGSTERSDGLDEMFCESPHSRAASYRCLTAGLNETMRAQVANMRPVGKCNGVIECPYADDECLLECNKSDLTFPACSSAELEKRLARYQTDFFKRGCGVVNGETPLNSRVLTEACNGRPFCDNNFDESICDDSRFTCVAKQRVGGHNLTNIARSNVCDMNIDCLDATDEMDCGKTHFYCENHIPLFVRRKQVHDGFVDCSDGSDERVDVHHFPSFGLIRIYHLRFLVWIPGIVSILGNLFALNRTIGTILRSTSKRGIPFCNSFLISNLALSDLLMGISLIVIGVESYRNNDKFNVHDRELESTTYCQMVGIFTVISSQTSMFLLVLLTGLRLYLTANPFMNRQLNHRLLILLVMTSWGVATFLALIPVIMHDEFTDLYLIARNRYFRRHNATREEINRFVSRTNQIRNILNQSAVFDPKDWSFTSTEAEDLFPRRRLEMKGSSSYYSSNGACFPNLYSRESPQFELSLSIILCNCLAIVFITVSYIYIYNAATNKGSGRILNAIDEDAKLRGRVAIVIITNLLCWIPIIIFSFYSYTHRETQIPHVLYTVSSVTLLPINSALNPIIYSRTDQAVKRIVLSLWGKLKSRHRRFSLFSVLSSHSGNFTVVQFSASSSPTLDQVCEFQLVRE